MRLGDCRHESFSTDFPPVSLALNYWVWNPSRRTGEIEKQIYFSLIERRRVEGRKAGWSEGSNSERVENWTMRRFWQSDKKKKKKRRTKCEEDISVSLTEERNLRTESFSEGWQKLRQFTLSTNWTEILTYCCVLLMYELLRPLHSLHDSRTSTIMLLLNVQNPRQRQHIWEFLTQFGITWRSKRATVIGLMQKKMWFCLDWPDWFEQPFVDGLSDVCESHLSHGITFLWLS